MGGRGYGEGARSATGTYRIALHRLGWSAPKTQPSALFNFDGSPLGEFNLNKKMVYVLADLSRLWRTAS